MNPLEKVVRGLDRRQQANRPLAFCFGVSKKFGDDRAGMLASLLAYDAFLAIFPLLLLLTTILGFVSDRNPAVRDAILHSALRDFPIVGSQLADSVHPLKGSVIAVLIGSAGLLWGSLGLSQAAQLAMAEVWNIPAVKRPGFFPRLGRSVAFVAALGVGIALTTFVTALAAFTPGAIASRVVAQLGITVVNVGLVVVLFRVLTPDVATRDLVPGGVIAGVGWTLLQGIGTLLVGHTLKNASQLYGFFGSVLGLVSWLFLTAQLMLYAAEVNVVRARKLWPRSIVQPPLTDADRKVLDAIAESERRRPEQLLRTGWRRRTA
ncbi:MAG TPA: YhjD/YihY/BrkB family envelope integrity protein [Acidimicrobiales bacterium]|nr:YhjD/YihY/BrkB family envelope integrity protein [Acidimicrobiales bacterium]